MEENKITLMWKFNWSTMIKITNLCKQIRTITKHILKKRVVDLNKLDEIHILCMELDTEWFFVRLGMDGGINCPYLDFDSEEDMPEWPLEDLMLRITEFVNNKETFAPSELATVTVIREYVDQILKECEEAHP